MPVVTIDARRIRDFDSFHDVFSEVFGFPEHYGRNLDAWIDCMTYLDDPEAGMTSIHGSPRDPVVLHLQGIEEMPQEIVTALNDCAAFVNWRRIEAGGTAILALSYGR